MARDSEVERSERVVVLAPFARDAMVLDRILRKRRIEVVLSDRIGAEFKGPDGLEVGIFLLTAEAMKPDILTELSDLLRAEPLWSAVPILLLGETERHSEDCANKLRNARDGLPVTILIRPCDIIEIASAVGSALTARRRQYDIAALIARHQRAEEHAEFLFEELSHRIKNVFGMVSALASQTEASTETSSEFRAAFGSRMTALSRAYDALREGNWRAASFEVIVREAVTGLLVPGEKGRIIMSGPAIELPSNQASGLALVLHELASNARKYGALSGAGGRVDVRWSHDRDGLIDLSWTETGGPRVSAPDRKGFGTTVVETAMPGAETNLFYKPEGLRCRIQFHVQTG